jgi:hypothetical protein
MIISSIGKKDKIEVVSEILSISDTNITDTNISKISKITYTC